MEADPDDPIFSAHSTEHLAGNLLYLAEHDLIETHIRIGIDNYISMASFRATKKGIDFLADDGGLSAILGVVTIKLHEDSLKALIENKIKSADLPEPEKRLWLDALKTMPAEAAKQLAVRLMDAGISHGPNIMHTVGTFLGITT